jgi:hypothetical protein
VSEHELSEHIRTTRTRSFDKELTCRR